MPTQSWSAAVDVPTGGSPPGALPRARQVATVMRPSCAVLPPVSLCFTRPGAMNASAGCCEQVGPQFHLVPQQTSSSFSNADIRRHLWPQFRPVRTSPEARFGPSSLRAEAISSLFSFQGFPAPAVTTSGRLSCGLSGFWGGHVPTPTPLSSYDGMLLKPWIVGLVGAECGWEGSPITLVVVTTSYLVHG